VSEEFFTQKFQLKVFSLKAVFIDTVGRVPLTYMYALLTKFQDVCVTAGICRNKLKQIVGR
jgi:hypothetical protein